MVANDLMRPDLKSGREDEDVMKLGREDEELGSWEVKVRRDTCGRWRMGRCRKKGRIGGNVWSIKTG
jgi:hypothetical protein